MHTILIVDDQDEIRKLIRHTLEGLYTLREARNAEEAEAVIRRERPRGVLLDVMMPGRLNGYELCEQIKSDPELKATYVALITARGQEADLERGRRTGADDYFVKPFSPLALIRRLEERLGD